MLMLKALVSDAETNETFHLSTEAFVILSLGWRFYCVVTAANVVI